MEGGRRLGWDIASGRTSEIRDSLRKLVADFYRSFVDGSNHTATIYRNDTLVFQMPFDSLTAKYDEANYKNLDVGLYKRSNDSLVQVSKDPDDLMKRDDGIYFVPFPGYGVRGKYSKKEVLRLVDSVSHSASLPEKLVVEPVK